MGTRVERKSGGPVYYSGGMPNSDPERKARNIARYRDNYMDLKDIEAAEIMGVSSRTISNWRRELRNAGELS